MSKKTIRQDNFSGGLPGDFGKLGNVGIAMDASWAKIPTYYYDVRQHSFPLTTQEFDDNFDGGQVSVFDTDTPEEGRQTNASTAAGVNEPFLAMGVGIVAIGQGEAFTLPLTVHDRPAPGSCTPGESGCVSGSTTTRQGALWWGSSTWHFIEAFFQAFRLQISVNRRFLLTDESLFDIGMVPTPPEFVGAGDSLLPAMPFVRATNDVLKSKSTGKVMIPNNFAGSSCVGAPTVNATFGHPRIIGLGNRMFCFQNPIPVLPGMRFDTKFMGVQGGSAFTDAMRRASVFDYENPTTPDADLTETVCNTTLFSSAFTVPGGVVSLGLVFKGYALQPQACLDYVANYTLSGSRVVDMLAGNSYLTSLLVNAKHANLAGIDEDVAKRLLSGTPNG